MGPPYNDGIVMEYTFELSNRIISTQIMKYMTNLICYLGYLGVFEYALAPTKKHHGGHDDSRASGYIRCG